MPDPSFVSFEPKLVGTEAPSLSAKGALVVDAGSGRVLHEKAPDTPLLPASTTKIMTALVSLEAYGPGDVLTVKNVNIPGQRVKLVPGEQITADALLYGLLVFSGNDAAEALADNYEGGREAFVRRMNEIAEALGLENTHFKNPTGFDHPEQVSTARDMIKLSVHAMKNPKFAEIVGTEQITVESVDGELVHRLENLNLLLGDVEGVLGVKTGWTEAAQENLVTLVERDGRKVFVVVLGSLDRFGETRKLIDWVYGSHEWVQVVDYPPHSL